MWLYLHDSLLITPESISYPSMVVTTKRIDAPSLKPFNSVSLLHAIPVADIFIPSVTLFFSTSDDFRLGDNALNVNVDGSETDTDVIIVSSFIRIGVLELIFVAKTLS